MTKPWRPSNGNDGMLMENICAECKHDRAFQRGEGDSCPIAASLYANGTTPEWVIEDGRVRCTAFLYDDGTEVPYRCEKTPDLFDSVKRA